MKRAISAIFFSFLFLLPTLAAYADDGAAYLGSRRELFIDEFLVGTLDDVELTFHRPERKEVVMEFDRPWEMGGEGYATVLKVGDKYLLYYRAWGLATTFRCATASPKASTDEIGPVPPSGFATIKA